MKNQKLERRNLRELVFNFTCKFLGWHEPLLSEIQITNSYFLSKCKHCGKEIIQLSDGTWARCE